MDDVIKQIDKYFDSVSDDRLLKDLTKAGFVLSKKHERSDRQRLSDKTSFMEGTTMTGIYEKIDAFNGQLEAMRKDLIYMLIKEAQERINSEIVSISLDAHFVPIGGWNIEDIIFIKRNGEDVYLTDHDFYKFEWISFFEDHQEILITLLDAEDWRFISILDYEDNTEEATQD